MENPPFIGGSGPGSNTYAMIARIESIVNSATVAVALAIATMTSAGSASAIESCILDWSEAGPIVRREGLASIEQVGRLARDRAAVSIVTSALCRSDGRYVYRLTVRGGQGGLRTLVVDARQPFAP